MHEVLCEDAPPFYHEAYARRTEAEAVACVALTDRSVS